MFVIQKKHNRRIVILLSFFSLSLLGNWTDNLSEEELLQHFKFDPECPLFSKQLKNDTKLVDTLRGNYERATFALKYMGFERAVSYQEKDYAYRFARCMEDPLAYDHFNTIKNTLNEQKMFKMHQCIAILEERLLYTQLIHWKAGEIYKECNMDPVLQKELLEKIWDVRYVFANAMNDPFIELFIKKELPKKKEIPVRFQELLMQRWLRMRAKMKEFGIAQYARYPQIEKALYCLLDQFFVDSDPFAVIDHMKAHSSDVLTDFYNVFFDEFCLSRAFEHDRSLLQGIEVSPEIGKYEYVDLRACYEKLLVCKCKDGKMREAIRMNLKIIMHACRVVGEHKDTYKEFAQRIFDIIIYDNYDRHLLGYPNLLFKALQKDCISLLHELLLLAKKAQYGSLDAYDKKRIDELVLIHT